MSGSAVRYDWMLRRLVEDGGGLPDTTGHEGDVLTVMPDGSLAWAPAGSAADPMLFKGNIDASTNPNYPAANAGWVYGFSADGKIGGASGTAVKARDSMICLVDTVGGDQAAVGDNWDVLDNSTTGGVTGPASATSGNFALYDGTSGKVLKDTGVNASSFDAAGTAKTHADLTGTAVHGLGGAAVLGVGASAGTVAAGDDARIVGAAQGPASAVDGRLAAFDTTTGKLLKDSGYSPASFAAATVISDKLSIRTIGVTGSGADHICDGTDDQVQFTEAVAALPAGGILHVLAGDYYFSATLTVDKGLEIRGTDRTLSIIHIGGFFTGVKLTATGCIMRLLSIVSSAAAGDTNGKTPLLHLKADAQKVEDCLITCTQSWMCAVMANCRFHVFQRNVITAHFGIALSWVGDGGYVGNPPSGIVINDNIFGDFALGAYCVKAIWFDNCQGNDIKITGNRILAFSAVYCADTAAQINVYANSFYLVTGLYFSGCSNLNINGNIYAAGYTPAICVELNSVTFACLDSNNFNTATTDYVRVSGACTKINITGNNGAGAPSGGITETDTSDYTTVGGSANMGVVTLIGAHSVNKDLLISGAVQGPASATGDNFPLFDGVTGKRVKNSAYNASSFQPASASIVMGPASATDGAIALFDQTTGKLLKNSAYTPASFQPAGASIVMGPASATDGAFPLFDQTTGKLIKNSAYTPASFATAAHAAQHAAGGSDAVTLKMSQISDLAGNLGGGLPVSFTDASLTAGILTVTHTLGIQYMHVSVIDNTGAKIIPDQVYYDSTSVLRIDLSGQGTLTGAWIALLGCSYPGANLLRNGDFEVAQRGTTFAAAGGYTIDGFVFLQSSECVVTVTQDTDVPTFAQAGHLSRHSLKVQVTTADTSIGVTQFATVDTRVEGYDLYPTVGKSVTLSFWVKAKKTGIYCVSFLNSVADMNMVKEYTVNVADTWEKKTITFVMNYVSGTWNYTNGIGFMIRWMLACGSTYQTTKDSWQSTSWGMATSSQVNALDSTANYISLSQVKLEVGAVASQFVPVPYAQELARCQRYLQRLDVGGSGSIGGLITWQSATLGWWQIPLKVTMCAQPAIVSSAITTFSATSGATSVTMTGGNFARNATSTTENFIVNLTVNTGGADGKCGAIWCSGGAGTYFMLTSEL